jgi:hypothetical protein
MRSKVVGVTKTMYLLCLELERLEESDEINFAAFYSFAEILESSHYCPGFEFDKRYFEVQYNKDNCLQLIVFPFSAHMGDEGTVLSEEGVLELIEELKTLTNEQL